MERAVFYCEKTLSMLCAELKLWSHQEVTFIHFAFLKCSVEFEDLQQLTAAIALLFLYFSVQRFVSMSLTLRPFISSRDEIQIYLSKFTEVELQAKNLDSSLW